jgi:hypothetical protein
MNLVDAVVRFKMVVGCVVGQLTEVGVERGTRER